MDDEKGSGGLWDKAAEIALEVAQEMRKNGLLREGITLYAEECGQEIIYQQLKIPQTL